MNGNSSGCVFVNEGEGGKKSKKSADVINGRPFTKSNFGIFNIDIDYEQPVFLLQIHYILSLPVGQAVAKYQVQLRDRVR